MLVFAVGFLLGVLGFIICCLCLVVTQFVGVGSCCCLFVGLLVSLCFAG